MKRTIRYIASFLCLALALSSCEKYEPDFFDEAENGVYFDYEYASELSKTLNFSDYIVGRPDTVSLTLKVKLLGYLQEEARALSVKAKAMEGYKLANVKIVETTFANKEYEKDLEILVERPKEEDELYAVCIYLDGGGDIGKGINGRDSIYLYVTETYDMPSVWYSHMSTYLGAWSKEKHIFLAEFTGDNHFYEKLYDNDLGLHLYDSILSLHMGVVDVLLSDEPTDSVTFALPILKKSDFPTYSKPYFWDDYKQYLGEYSVDKFCNLTTLLGGSDTRNVASLYAENKGGEKMMDFHATIVKEMLNSYYNFAMQGYTIAEYDSSCWVQLDINGVYSVGQPFWWEDPQGLGTAEIVKKYFGEYEESKYLFMLQTMLKADGAENFIAASIFPFAYDKEQNQYVWDSTPFGSAQLAGEDRLKECYRIIHEANKKRAPSRRFDIPEVELD